MKKTLKLTFLGGVGSVTGANFLLEDLSRERPLRILIDCGLMQGSRFAMFENQKPFAYDPKTIDFLFVTHAHIDHIGRIPKLVREGFRGRIVSTGPTQKLAPLMLDDALKILEQECRQSGETPFYELADIKAAVSLWESVDYHEVFPISSGIEVKAMDAGHILGSAMFEFRINEQKLVFTGDLGNTPTPLLRNTEDLANVSYLVMESVYGDRNHEDRASRLELIKRVIEETTKKGGALLVPIFSLEKTQVLLSEINFLVENQEIKSVPVFLDSPLAIKVTEIYREESRHFNLTAQAAIGRGDDIFSFPRLKFTETPKESRVIRNIPNPKIILAGSGMSSGGRIVRHEREYLDDPKSTILFIGYQAVGSLGREIQEGAKVVDIEGEQVEIKARIATVDGYSSHKDSEHLVEFVEKTASTLKKVFVVMGEPRASMFLAQRLREYLEVDAKSPQPGESVELTF